jgi:hypothetical protein
MNKAQQLLQRMALNKENADAISQYWLSLFPEFQALEQRQIVQWTNMYDFDTVVFGLDKAMQQHNKRLQAVEEQTPNVVAMVKLDIVKYASGVMKRHVEDAKDKAKPKVVNEGITEQEQADNAHDEALMRKARLRHGSNAGLGGGFDVREI